MSTPPPYGQQQGYGQGGHVPPPPAPDSPQPQTPAQPPAQAGYGAQPQQQPRSQQPGQQQPGASAYPGQHAPAQHPGQQGHPQQAGHGTPGAHPGRRRGRTTTVVVTALVTAAVSVTATLLATGALTGPSVLERDALQDGVTGILTDEFALSDVDDVTCPDGVEAVAGAEFECSFSSGGEDLSVPVEVLNDAGQYRVGGPLDE